MIKMILKEIKMILKEKDTWSLGTGLFIGSLFGIIIGNATSYKPDLPMKLILLIILYLTWVFLVALIKWSDRSLIEYRLKL